ncbi:hypothetical protein, partial [Actinacidiphila rubida]|uniref:hypothetical protein n=1 Tax=Actinacidiphila rubida TaxID=310780 RepID=UPI001C4064E7
RRRAACSVRSGSGGGEHTAGVERAETVTVIGDGASGLSAVIVDHHDPGKVAWLNEAAKVLHAAQDTAGDAEHQRRAWSRASRPSR